MRIYRHYIDGAFAEPSSAAWFDSTDPYSGDVWAKVAHGGAEDVPQRSIHDRVVEAYMQVKSVWIAQETSVANPFVMR